MHRKPCSNSCSPAERQLFSSVAATALTSLIALSSLLPTHAYSADTEHCSHRLIENTTAVVAKTDDDQTHISADQTRTHSDGKALFEGDVVIQQDGRFIQADEAIYDREEKRFELTGNIRLDNGNLQMKAASGSLQTDSGGGRFKDVQYLLNSNNLRGQANDIDTRVDSDGHNLSLLSDTSITSCKPDAIDWLLQADSIEIDHTEQYGKADDVTLQFKGVTFFYTPYMEFPVGDRRRSGLLAPEWSSSDSRGFELVVPWYWNIAPNHDATIAPHYMRKRGLQLDTAYRFLTQSSHGELKSAFLNEDDVTGNKRYHTVYRQTSQLMDNLVLGIDIQDVSDIDYFDDFSNSLTDTSQTHLNRSAVLSQSTEHWQSRLIAQSYETVDANIAITNRPYRKLPQITSQGLYSFLDDSLRLTIDTSYTDFEHQLSSKTTGSRFNLSPALSTQFRGGAWYVEPALRLNHISYQLDDSNAPDAINVMTSSLDAGLFFERELGDGLLQTLEPRLFYLNTPFKDQSSSPNFDSSIPTFSFAQLFRHNRFSGGDRIGDAEQLTAALSSRIIATDTGDEYLRASVGQIIYLDDRKVTLTGSSQTDEQSDLVAELASQWQDWRFRASWQWDNTHRDSERQNFLLRYQSDHNKLFNLAYRQQDDLVASSAIEQTDVSFVSPLSDSMSLYARWNYSLIEHSDIDVIAGIGYDSCCWSLRVIAQRNRITDTSDQFDNSIQVQLVLKGLGSVSGNKLTSTLSNAIPGYYDQDI